jgi:hypothetical protein
MRADEIVVQQRLHTTGFVALLGLAFALFLNVGVVMANTTNGHALPIWGVLIAVAVLLLLLVFILVALRIEVRVVSAPQGRALEVAYGPGGYLRQIFRAERIVSVSTLDVSFLESGGRGYRGSLRFRRRASLVTRRGTALQLNLEGERRFIVTVDDPEAFITALQIPSDSTLQ